MTVARRLAVAALCGLAGLTLRPAPARAQLPGADTGWPPLEVGARVGLTNIQQDVVLGALLRVPAWRTGNVELMPSGDITFLGPIHEYQLNLDAVYVLLGRNGGPYLGGGIGFRNTVPPASLSGGRETLTAINVVVGLKLTGLGRVSPLLEFRRAVVSELPVDPQLLSIGATVALW